MNKDQQQSERKPKRWDIFLSYAHADRAEVAQPLAVALESLGLRVWLDHTELKVGDSLQEKIDEGLRLCRLGVVILSHAFFSHHYPVRELRGLAQREVNGKKVILPVWHRVSEEDVRNFSPPLADRVAARTEDGVNVVALKIFEVANPQLFDAARKEISAAAQKLRHLEELTTGSQLVQVIRGSFAFNFGNEDPADTEEMELVSGFLQHVQDLGDILGDLDVSDRIQAEFDLNKSMKKLREAGWRVFGRRSRRPIKMGKETEDWPVAMVVLAREGTHGVVETGEGSFAVIPGQKLGNGD